MCHNLDLILLNFQKHLLLWTMQRDECHISPCRPLVALASLFLKVVAFFQSVFGDAAFSKSRESPIRTDMELLSNRSMILKTPTKNPVGISLKYIKCIFFFSIFFLSLISAFNVTHSTLLKAPSHEVIMFHYQWP